VAREKLEVSTAELVILAELLLRGPQTLGELRGRASRMHPLDSLEATEALLAGLRSREDPLVRELAPMPGSRAPRWVQLLSPTLHALDAPAAPDRDDSHSGHDDGTRIDALAALEARVHVLEESLEALRRSLGS
ncbi:MAG: DUF480 domain-containing protein, partial [Phycisphaerae bacterium]|nr:DUF480 domain-containing protein [Phycisphaerae bacterium]